MNLCQHACFRVLYGSPNAGVFAYGRWPNDILDHHKERYLRATAPASVQPPKETQGEKARALLIRWVKASGPFVVDGEALDQTHKDTIEFLFNEVPDA